MTDHDKDIEEWDPDEAREKLSSKGMKMPVTFIRDIAEEPDMEMDATDPPERVITITKKPSIVTLGKKNKNALF